MVLKAKVSSFTSVKEQNEDTYFINDAKIFLKNSQTSNGRIGLSINGTHFVLSKVILEYSLPRCDYFLSIYPVYHWNWNYVS